MWYSSTWCDSALRAFRRALGAILGDRSRQYTKEVISFLTHWQAHSVTLKKARQEWLAGREASEATWLGNLKLQEDRLAACAYELTGDIAGGGPYGSIVMFTSPPGWKLRMETGQSALCTVRFDELLRERVNARDIVAAATGVIMRGVKQVMELVRSNALVVEVTTAPFDLLPSHLAQGHTPLSPTTCARSITSSLPLILQSSSRLPPSVPGLSAGPMSATTFRLKISTTWLVR